MAAVDVLELIDFVNFGAHGDVGDFFKDDLDHHRHAEPGCHHPRLPQCRFNISRVFDAQRLATQPFNHGHMVYTIAAQFVFRIGHIDVVKRQLHAKVHLKAALALANQAQVGVVDQHMHIRQVELRTHGKFLDQKLEVVVTGNCHYCAGRVCRYHAQCCGHGPAQRASLAAIDPLARAINIQELARSNLAQANVADVHRIAREHFVHLLVNTLWLDRNVVVMGFAMHQALTLGTAAGPVTPAGQLACCLALTSDFHK